MDPEQLEQKPTRVILSHLVGPRIATKLLREHGGSVLSIMKEQESGESRAALRLRAAREILRRAYAEQIRQQDAVTSPDAVIAFLKTVLANRDREIFMVLFLNTRHQVIATEEMFAGTINEAPVYPREIARTALKYNADAVILAHNHPSGAIEPSEKDKILTAQVQNAMGTISIRVLDHILIAGNLAISFRQKGLM